MGCAISTTSAPEGILPREDVDREVVPGAPPEVLGTKGEGEDSAIIKGCIKEKDWDPQHIHEVSGGAWSSGRAAFSEMVPPMSRVIDVKGDSTPLYREQALVPARPSEGMPRGMSVLTDPGKNRGGAFTEPERTLFGLKGLLPPGITTLRGQEALLMSLVKSAKSGIEKHRILQSVKAHNNTVFYRTLAENPAELLPVIWTPTVGEACVQHGKTALSTAPLGLYITINDRHSVSNVVANWPHGVIKVIVLTDGENVFGLGDLGSHAMPLAVSKCELCTACAGIPPSQCLAVCIDTGTDNVRLQKDPKYVGLRQSRVRGQEYFDFLDEVMSSISVRWPDAITMFEAFSSDNAFKLLNRYRTRHCTLNDDINSTASVVLASLMSSCRIKGSKLSDETMLLYGAGNSGCGIATLIVQQLVADGLSETDARSKIWMMDSHGLLVSTRADIADVAPQKRPFARRTDQGDGSGGYAGLLEVIEHVKPSCIIGVSDQGGSFNKQVLEAMSRINERPIVFALSTPEKNAECTAHEAYMNTAGKGIFCSGAPFPSVMDGHTTFTTSQAVNAYIFPGVIRGVASANGGMVSDSIMLTAARALSQTVSDADLHYGSLLPPLTEMRSVCAMIGSAVATHILSADGSGGGGGEPYDEDVIAVDVEAHMYRPAYGEMFTAPTDVNRLMMGNLSSGSGMRSAMHGHGKHPPSLLIGDGMASTMRGSSIRSNLWST